MGLVFAFLLLFLKEKRKNLPLGIERKKAEGRQSPSGMLSPSFSSPPLFYFILLPLLSQFIGRGGFLIGECRPHLGPPPHSIFVVLTRTDWTV
jgi:hypothetical protein